jgi:hypothetical protein
MVNLSKLHSLHWYVDSGCMQHMTDQRSWFKTYQGKITMKGATQVNGHSLKLHFCMFERSQGKYNSLDCHKNFWNIFL